MSLQNRNLEVGDRVFIADPVDASLPESIRQRLSDLYGSTILSLNGDWLELSAKDGAVHVKHIHRKYFCLVAAVGHVNSPCDVCGYEGTVEA